MLLNFALKTIREGSDGRRQLAAYFVGRHRAMAMKIERMNECLSVTCDVL